MIEIAICDDNEIVCSAIEQHIIAYQKQVDMPMNVERFTRGEDLLTFIENEHSFDLMFLDIELGTTTGVEVGHVIRHGHNDDITQIVFITAKQGYEQQLFDLQPLNFLQKPIQAKKLEQCITLAIKRLQQQNKTFVYRKAYKIIRVQLKDILYFEKSGKKTKIVTHKTIDECNESLGAIKVRLPQTFVEPHESFLIHFDKIYTLEKDAVTMINGEKVPVSRRNLKKMHDLLIAEMEQTDVFL